MVSVSFLLHVLEPWHALAWASEFEGLKIAAVLSPVKTLLVPLPVCLPESICKILDEFFQLQGCYWCIITSGSSTSRARVWRLKRMRI